MVSVMPTFLELGLGWRTRDTEFFLKQERAQLKTSHGSHQQQGRGIETTGAQRIMQGEQRGSCRESRHKWPMWTAFK